MLFLSHPGFLESQFQVSLHWNKQLDLDGDNSNSEPSYFFCFLEYDNSDVSLLTFFFHFSFNIEAQYFKNFNSLCIVFQVHIAQLRSWSNSKVFDQFLQTSNELLLRWIWTTLHCLTEKWETVFCHTADSIKMIRHMTNMLSGD